MFFLPQATGAAWSLGTNQDDSAEIQRLLHVALGILRSEFFYYANWLLGANNRSLFVASVF